MPTIKRPRSQDESENSSKRNKSEGRPVRSSAGRKSLPKDYVDPSNVIEDDSDSEFEISMKDDEMRKPWSKRKTRTSPQRELPPEDSFVDSALLALADESSSVTSRAPHELNLTFNVPPGHSGAFVVKLDLGSILSKYSGASSESTSVFGCSTSPSLDSTTFNPAPQSPADSDPNKLGFLSLPAELRNKVYFKVFVTKAAVNLRDAENFARSAAFLATCRQIYREGTQILYGENIFELLRKTQTRAAYYEKEWKEVGYKDCFRFLATIGPSNISCIRDLSLVLDDGNIPFLDDDDLMECLKLLAKHGRLAKLKLGIHGKRMVRPSEYRFIHNMTAVKADSVEMTQNYRRLYGSYWSRQKRANVSGDLDVKMVEKMQRKIKIRTDLPLSSPAKERARAKPKPNELCSQCRWRVNAMICRHYECFLDELCRRCLQAFHDPAYDSGQKTRHDDDDFAELCW